MPAMTPSRRQVLLSTAGLAAAGPLTQLTLPTTAAAADAYDALRERWRTVLLGSGYDPGQEPYASALAELGDVAVDYLDSILPSGSSLWADLPLGSVSRNMSTSFSRLATIAHAYAAAGTGLTGDSGARAAVLDGLDMLVTEHFRDDGQTYDNWFHWQISSPRSLLDTSALIYDELDPARLTSYLASVDAHTPVSVVANGNPGSVGANRVNHCRVIALSGVLGKDSAKLTVARDELSLVFATVLRGDGIYPDGSFIQHSWIPYAGGYGVDLLGGLTRLFALLSGSQWDITDPNRQNVLDAVTHGFAPLLHNGLIMDSVSGRGVALGLAELDPHQIVSGDHHRGQAVIREMIRLADSGLPSTAERDAWRSIAKGLLERDYFLPAMSRPGLDAATLSVYASVLEDATLSPAPPPTDHHIFGPLDRSSHRRPTWAAGISMSSERIAHYEHGNGENRRSWHTGSGMLYWWGQTSLGQYSDSYWCTVNPYRQPGTTVSTKTLADGAGGSWGASRPAIKWAGGATDGTYGAVGQDVRGIQSTLTGRKSWFGLDGSIVCLGAGITATDGVPVETIVENRNLGESGNHTLTVDGVTQPSTLGWSQTFVGAQSIALSGFGGYVFPGGAAVRALREARQGTWQDTHPNGSPDVFVRRYLTLWHDHGVDPAGATYHYELMPGADAAAAAARASSPATVLANTSSVQAVTDTATGVSAANFFAAGSAGPITVDAPCSVLMRESGGTLTVAVADPTRTASTVRVTINRSGFSSATGDDTVSVLATSPIELLVEVGGSLGASHTITFGTGGSVSPATATSLVPDRDSFVRGGSYAGTNYGSATYLQVRTTGSPSYTRRSFLAFDVSGLAAAPSRAVLWVHAAVTDSGGTHAEMQAHAAPGSWTENGLTWNNQPSLGAQLVSRLVSDRADWHPFDVTAAVQAQFGSGEASLAIAQAANGLLVRCDSGEAGNASLRPHLQVVV